VLRQWRHGEQMILGRNPNYWQSGKPNVDSARLMVVVEDNSRVLQLQSGDLDAMIRVCTHCTGHGGSDSVWFWRTKPCRTCFG
jgi:ABC-type transport system substrate-binding protein